MSSWFNVKVTELQLEDVRRFVPPRVYYTIQKQIEQIAGGSKFSKVHEHDYAMPDLYIRTSLSDRTAVWKILQRWAAGRTTGWVDDIRVDFTGYGLALGHNDEEITRALRAAKQLGMSFRMRKPSSSSGSALQAGTILRHNRHRQPQRLLLFGLLVSDLLCPCPQQRPAQRCQKQQASPLPPSGPAQKQQTSSWAL